VDAQSITRDLHKRESYSVTSMVTSASRMLASMLDAPSTSRGFPMAKPIIAALRANGDLKRTVLQTAIEMAHMASFYGVLRKSLDYLAKKCRCSKNTVIAHIKLLIKLKILAKTTRRRPGTYLHAVNVYRFLVPWRGKPPALHKGAGSQETAHNFPAPPKDIPEAQLLEGMKEGRFADLIRGKMRVLGYFTEGSQRYMQLKEEIGKLIQESRWAEEDLDKLLQGT